MTVPTQARVRLVRSAFVALLMTSVATGAMAAPKKSSKGKSTASSTAALTAEVNELRSQVEQLKAAMAAQTAAQPAAQAQQAQIDTLNQQIAEMKTQQDTANADIITLKAPPSGSTVITTVTNGKPSFTTADKRFSANIRAIVMFDTGAYLQKSNLPPAITGNARDLNDGTNFRRARFGIDGKLFGDFDYALIYEFGGSGTEDAGHIQEAWLQYNGIKPLRIRAGAFEPNVGLAAAVSTSQMPMLERPSSAEIARNVAAGDSRMAVQVQSNGIIGAGDSGVAYRWFASTAFTGNTVSTLNSAGGFAVQPFGEQQGWVGRITMDPYESNTWQVHFGFNMQYVFHANDNTGGASNPRYPIQLRDRPELRIDSTRLIDTGAIDVQHVTVMGGEFGAQYKNFLVEGEYSGETLKRRVTTTPVGDANFQGYYIQGTWGITGEARPYNGVESRWDAPKIPYNFNPSAGTWGVFELAVRYSEMNLNYNAGVLGKATPVGGIRGGEQQIIAAGINWYLNPVIRFMLDYSHVSIDRLNPAGLTMSQDFNTIALRTQFAF
jgi:phosphate-selective porin OprO/OprP